MVETWSTNLFLRSTFWFPFPRILLHHLMSRRHDSKKLTKQTTSQVRRDGGLVTIRNIDDGDGMLLILADKKCKTPFNGFCFVGTI